MTTTCWVSVEGLNGVGKTYLTGQLAARLGGSCRLLSELTDHGANQLTGQVVAAMQRAGGTFLRTGHPVTETLALLALKVYEYEHVTADSPPPALVVEDRGLDTVAVYQAAILTAEQRPDTAAALVSLIIDAGLRWRQLPARTLLLVDDLDTCLDRFAARLGTPVQPADRDLLARVERIYRDLADAQSDRIRVIDRRGRDETDVLDEMETHCRTAMKEAITP